MLEINQCNRCKIYYTEKECPACTNEHIVISEGFAENICNYFGYKNQRKFLRFLFRVFPNYDDFKVFNYRRRQRHGSYFRMVLAIFYIFANLDKDYTIRMRKVYGLLQQHTYHRSNFRKYIDVAYTMIEKRFRWFKDTKIRRRIKLENNIKSLLGKLRKPVVFNHVVSFIEFINYDNPRMDVETVALVYIMFYYKDVRGWSLYRKDFGRISRVSVRTVTELYYSEFKAYREKAMNDNFVTTYQRENEFV